MSYRVLGGVALLAGLALFIVGLEADPERSAPRGEKVGAIGPERPIAQYSGPGSVSLTAEGEWIAEFPGAQEPLIFIPSEEAGNLPMYPVKLEGDVDLILDGARLWVIVMTHDEEYYEATLELADEQAVGVAESLTRAELVRDSAFVPEAGATSAATAPDDDLGYPLEHDCGGGSCSCTGKCSVCCPSGFLPYCSCGGSGTCRCVKGANPQ